MAMLAAFVSLLVAFFVLLGGVACATLFILIMIEWRDR